MSAHHRVSRLASVARLWQCLWAALLLGALCACTDDSDCPAADDAEVGSLSLSLSTGGLSVRTRATSDPDYYLATADIFFYPGGTADEAPAYSVRDVNLEAYDIASISKGLTNAQVDKLFPGSETTCTVYVVANMTDSIKHLSAPTINQLKAWLIEADLPTHAAKQLRYPMAMDGMGIAVLDRSKMAISGTITLQRALAKILLNIAVADTVVLGDEKYVAVTSSASAIHVDLMAGSTTGLLGGPAPYEQRKFTGSENPYVKSYSRTGETFSESDANTGTTRYTRLTHTPFYTFPNEWRSNEAHDGDEETTLQLLVPWKKITADGSEDYISYYYQIPVNYSGMRVERNHYYKISLKVGMLGNKEASDPLRIPDPDYEILGWGNDDSQVLADLSKSHYLVVEDSKFTIWNESSLSFAYYTCSELQGATLTSISYASTLYTDSNGDPTTVYLYNTTYNASTKTYSEATYSTNDKAVRSTYSGVVSYINSMIKSGGFITNTINRSSDGVSEGVGTITLTADIDQIASIIYHPITYTIELENSREHNGLRYTVTVTQYPSKYIAFSEGGNVFVNGYYARLIPDAGSTTASLPTGWNSVTVSGTTWYRCDGFTYQNYSASKGSYSNSSSYYQTSSGIDYGYGSTSIKPAASNYSVSSSYEFLRGALSSNIAFKNTIDVAVSAFTKDDNTFTVTRILTNADGSYARDANNTVITYSKTYEYAIGDPRGPKGVYYADDHTNTSSYDYASNKLYDYMTTSGKTGSTYYRYIASWGDYAQQIRIGGQDAAYDNVIAPLFKIQSSYGAAMYKVYFNVAQKRCATYQEAGYPAGRWRLPTLAEIAFIVRLQNTGVIEKMFDDNETGYWTSSGGRYVANSDLYYTQDYYNENRKNAAIYVRCVYDLWYWQDGQHTPTTKYYPLPYQ